MAKYSNHNGKSLKDAIIILDASNTMEGVDAEYDYLNDKYGKQGINWKLKRQSLIFQDGLKYDKMEIILKDGTEKIIYFDITVFFGKL